MFDTVQLTVLEYIAEEVTRQHRPPIAVAWMAAAWAEAVADRDHVKRNRHDVPLIGPAMIVRWGQQVEPYQNAPGIRWAILTAPTNTALPVAIGADLMDLCDACCDGTLTPAAAYRRFEEIHPFVDGNGRVGKILYNYLHDALDAPTMPPKFFDTDAP